MGRKPRVDRTPEEKWQIVQEGIKSGNVSETCRRHGIAPNLFYRWKDEAEQERRQRLGGEALPPRKLREGPSYSAVGTHAGTEVSRDRNPKKRRGGVSCGAVHSQAREMVTQGYTATLVAATLAISRSSRPTRSAREAAERIEPTMNRS